MPATRGHPFEFGESRRAPKHADGNLGPGGTGRPSDWVALITNAIHCSRCEEDLDALLDVHKSEEQVYVDEPTRHGHRGTLRWRGVMAWIDTCGSSKGWSISFAHHGSGRSAKGHRCSKVRRRRTGERCGWTRAEGRDGAAPRAERYSGTNTRWDGGRESCAVVFTWYSSPRCKAMDEGRNVFDGS